MKILGENELYARLDFMSPLHPEPEEPQGVYCIPFEWNGAKKGTRISIAKAKEISAELRASIAEAEGRIMREAYDQEVARNKSYAVQLNNANSMRQLLHQEANILKQQLRDARSGKRRRNK